MFLIHQDLIPSHLIVTLYNVLSSVLLGGHCEVSPKVQTKYVYLWVNNKYFIFTYPFIINVQNNLHGLHV